MSAALTILHASDLQCGRPFWPRAADAFVRFAQALAPDVVVISGDLTQRAKAREFDVAAALMARLPRVPTVVTPGNHDVPLYRFWERVLTPYRNWRDRISGALDSVTHVEGATFVALNSSAPRRAIVNGRIDAWQVDFARDAFTACAAGDVKALVIHHHFVRTPDGTGGKTLPNARALVLAFESMGADLVLGGHVHQTHVHTSRDLTSGAPAGLPLVACGSTTSRRGRGREADANSLNVVQVRAREIEVHPHLLRLASTDFEPADPIVLPRRRASELTTGASGA